MTIDDSLNVACALKRASATGGGTARLYDHFGETVLVVSWAPADDTACIVVPGGPGGRDSLLSIPGCQL